MAAVKPLTLSAAGDTQQVQSGDSLSDPTGAAYAVVPVPLANVNGETLARLNLAILQ